MPVGKIQREIGPVLEFLPVIGVHAIAARCAAFAAVAAFDVLAPEACSAIDRQRPRSVFLSFIMRIVYLRQRLSDAGIEGCYAGL